jgi:hypothetical protein
VQVTESNFEISNAAASKSARRAVDPASVGTKR